MATLEELAASLLGPQTQAAIAAENPYYKLQAVPDQVSAALLPAYANTKRSSKNMRDLAIGSILTGLLGGGLSSLGASKQNELTNQYLATALTQASGGAPISDGLTDNLFNSASRQGDLFKLLSGIETSRDSRELAKQKELLKANEEADLKKYLLKAAVENPFAFENAKPLLDKILGGGADPEASAEAPVDDFVVGTRTPQPGGQVKAAAAGTDPLAALDLPETSQVEQLLAAEERDLAIKAQKEAFLPPGAAGESARKAMETKRDELERQYARIEEAEKAATQLSSVADRARMALQEAGDTGYFGNVQQTIAGLAGGLFPEQEKKYAGGNKVKNLATDIVSLKSGLLKGPMSDKDVQILLSSGVSLTNDEAANEEIVRNWEYAANLQSSYAEFMRGAQARGLPVAKAEAIWKKYKEANPYIIKKAGGGVSINPNLAGVGGDFDTVVNSAAKAALARAELKRRGVIK